jgi:hypothetical protein
MADWLDLTLAFAGGGVAALCINHGRGWLDRLLFGADGVAAINRDEAEWLLTEGIVAGLAVADDDEINVLTLAGHLADALITHGSLPNCLARTEIRDYRYYPNEK